MTDIPVITTDRLVLRAPDQTDLAAYVAFYDVSDVKLGGYRGGRSPEDVAAILERDILHWRDKGFGMFVVRTRADGDVVGGVGLSHPDDWPSHELTWWLMPLARGKGYATEASRAVISWAYQTLGWSRVETHMRDENIPARKLALRLGASLDRRDTFPDGVSRDVFVLPDEGAA